MNANEKDLSLINDKKEEDEESRDDVFFDYKNKQSSIKQRRQLSFNSVKRPLSYDLDEYYDTMSQFSDKRNNIHHSYRRTNTLDKLSEKSYESNTRNRNPSAFKQQQSKPEIRQRRTEILAKPTSSNIKSLISMLKNMIGKDVTRSPLPATLFGEPISFLQRSAECLENSSLLDKAAACTDSLEQMTYVAAFSISEYAIYYDRLTKPFNPLLNETFEFDREDDYGWKLIAEQVGHHPPHFAVVGAFFN